MWGRCLLFVSIAQDIASPPGHLIEVYVIFALRVSTNALTLVLWNTYGDCENYGIMDGHKGAILDLQWSRDGRNIYTASADHTLGTWDVTTGERTRKHVGHEDIVNSVAVFRRGGETLVSGSDDCSIGVRIHSLASLILAVGSTVKGCRGCL